MCCALRLIVAPCKVWKTHSFHSFLLCDLLGLLVGFLHFYYFFLKLLSAVLHNHLLEQDYKNTTTPSEFVSVGTLLVLVGWSVCQVSFCEFDWILTFHKGFLFCFVFLVVFGMNR